MIKKQRYLSLDVFRGATVFLMILVNSPGEWGVQYGPLKHAPWHGFTITDLVFPAFLFAVGNAMAFVMEKYEQQGNVVFWKKILKRTVLIFMIGFLLSWFPFYDFQAGSVSPLSSTRIMGVLQRIALCYFFASILIHYGTRKQVILISAFLLVGYWAVLYFFGDPSDPYSLSGYVGNILDRGLLGEKHLYGGEGVPFDPEGLLSTIPSIVNVILGYLTGIYIRSKGHSYESIAKLLMVGVGLVVIALWWHLFFPINKKIWTSSFVLLTSGISILILGVLVYVIEMKEHRRWTYFFEVFGRNPLFIYALSWVLFSLFHLIPIGDSNFHKLTYGFFRSFAAPAHASFLFAVFFTMLNWLVGYALDRNKIYIKV